jgi:hypothetical protein
MFSGRPPEICGGPVYFFARYPNHVEARRRGRENRLAAEAAATDEAVCQQGEAPAGVESHPIVSIHPARAGFVKVIWK